MRLAARILVGMVIAGASPAAAWGPLSYELTATLAVDRTEGALGRFLRSHRADLLQRSEQAASARGAIQDRFDELVWALRDREPAPVLAQAGALARSIADAHAPPLPPGLAGRWGVELPARHHARIRIFLEERQLREPRAHLLLSDLPALEEHALSESRAIARHLEEVDRELRRSRLDSADALWERLGRDLMNRLWASADDTALVWTLAWDTAGRPALPERAPEPPLSDTGDPLLDLMVQRDAAGYHHGPGALP